MKKEKLIGMMVILAIGYLMYDPKETEISSLALKNIEALANNEYSEKYICYGTGSIACPDGTYAKYLIEL